jgi:hypothetical protein
MKRTIGGLIAGALAIQILPGGAWAAGCATQSDTAALRIAALQQELMVAAFSCHDVSRYNGFVLSHQPELVSSDAKLKAFFVRRAGGKQGEESYHTYKTELANSASLRSIRDTDSFCANAEDEFEASADRSPLSAFVDTRRWETADRYDLCPGVVVETAAATPLPHEGWRPHRRNGDEDSYRSQDYHDDAAPLSNRGDEDSATFYAPAPHRRMGSDWDR